MQLNFVFDLLLFAHLVDSQAMMCLACSQLSVERLDPIGNPRLESPTYLHQIADTGSHDTVGQSSCTSCTFGEDFSNYWTVVLYFRAKNGTYKRVP
ncbi:uncharacterized protein RAG0_03805 [Rhynchosporium agropyri]|uniref:DUF1996 domain-containing protein n=1 Tax=Rhynchosporium agropyri TaxID=914238 RepID=A0A1E1K6T4_9HELO|nr:uncharacterized protein RAG0_03805 [Rhynchosporium agropyri]